MALELNEGWVYSVRARRQGRLSDVEDLSLSDLEFVDTALFDESREVVVDGLEFVGFGRYEWTEETVVVFLDRVARDEGRDVQHLVFRESEIVAAEPTEANA